jgi:hypothetical protein
MRTAYMAISLVALVGLVPAAFAQGSPVVDPGKSAGTRTEAKRQMRTSGSNASVSLAVPTAKVSVGAESLEGEHDDRGSFHDPLRAGLAGQSTSRPVGCQTRPAGVLVGPEVRFPPIADLTSPQHHPPVPIREDLT